MFLMPDNKWAQLSADVAGLVNQNLLLAKHRTSARAESHNDLERGRSEREFDRPQAGMAFMSGLVSVHSADCE